MDKLVLLYGMIQRLRGREGVILVSALCMVVFILSINKALSASVTHDEASTYLNWVNRRFPLWKCVWSEFCWRNANNHLLNTWMIRRTTDLFGPSDLSLRLPNILFLGVFLAACGAFALKLARTWPVAILFSSILILQPFALDFFILARGYGIALGLMTVSFLGFLYYAHRRDPRWLAAAFVFGALSVFANLTYSAYFACLCALYAFILVHEGAIAAKGSSNRRLYRLGIPAACIFGTGAFFIKPVILLSRNGEFEYGTDSVVESMVSYFRNFLYGENYFAQLSPRLVAVVGTSVAVVAGIILVYHQFKTFRRNAPLQPELLVVLLSAGITAFFVVNFYVTGALLPVGRKTIIFHLPYALLLCYAINRLLYERKHHFLIQGMCIVVSAALIFHYATTYDKSLVREWWYDRDTKAMIDRVNADCNDGVTPCTLNVNWLFHPTTHYYILTKQLQVQLGPYSHTLLTDSDSQYFYAMPGDFASLGHSYVEERNYGDRKLLRRK